MKNKTEVKLIKNRAIIKFEGKNFLGEIGIDGRIFKALTYARISVGVISQQAIENGISVLVNEADAEKAVNALFASVEEARVKDDKVQVIGFGTFEVKAREARKGRNPQTGEEITIPASKNPVFKAGKALKDALN